MEKVARSLAGTFWRRLKRIAKRLKQIAQIGRHYPLDVTAPDTEGGMIGFL